jgi:structural maintenance of chromosome 2
MQGKILKVISMKPIEVLAMIEEAAGTRMFEMKKQNALKTIAKKDKKVEEINKVLKEEITPTLENLRKERALYIKWSNNQSDIERLTRFTVAYEYTKAQETLTASSADLQKMEDQLDSLKARENEINEILEQHKEQLAKLAKQKEKVTKHVL